MTKLWATYTIIYVIFFSWNWIICDLLLLPFATSDILLIHGGNPHNEPKCGLWLSVSQAPGNHIFQPLF